MTPLRYAADAFVTAGLIVVLFLGWETWFNSIVLNAGQSAAASTLSQTWISHAATAPAGSPADPPVDAAPGATEPLAVIYVPRLGSDWERTIRETVDTETVLNSYDAGVGHYPGTAMPGGVGNFAIAAHDSGYGNTFIDVSKLQIGDAIYIQTPDGWYTYRFRNFQYVQPDQVNVLNAVPTVNGAPAGARLITMTTCNPPFHAVERLIAYGSFESFQPLTAGAPAEIAATVASKG
ncbi:class E sortase [Subtercola vilae]|uniref:class E sortase n=1 Tax=Subtercola vilae TaxID=2056433 RepID=UPI001F242A65|nr:class E sortase [Subtercola vilae]